MIKDFMKVSPFQILEKTKSRGLGGGNLGVIIARAGVGKTACLIHFAFDRLFRKEKLVHVSLQDQPEKILSYYQVIFLDLIKALGLEDEHDTRMLLERNRMILAYLNQSFTMERLRENLSNLSDKLEFKPDTLVIDGLDFENTDRKLIKEFKELAEEFNTEIWFSALAHRHITDVNERCIPYPCDKVDDLFSIIIQLLPTQKGIFLKLLKDGQRDIKDDDSIRLDPNTFLAL